MDIIKKGIPVSKEYWEASSKLTSSVKRLIKDQLEVERILVKDGIEDSINEDNFVTKIIKIKIRPNNKWVMCVQIKKEDSNQ